MQPEYTLNWVMYEILVRIVNIQVFEDDIIFRD